MLSIALAISQPAKDTGLKVKEVVVGTQSAGLGGLGEGTEQT